MGIREVRLGTETVTEYLNNLTREMTDNGAANWAARLAEVVPAVQVLETKESVRWLHTAWTNHHVDCPDCTDGQCGYGVYLSGLVTEAKRELARLTTPRPEQTGTAKGSG